MVEMKTRLSVNSSNGRIDISPALDLETKSNCQSAQSNVQSSVRFCNKDCGAVSMLPWMRTFLAPFKEIAVSAAVI